MPDIKNATDYAAYEKAVADFIEREQIDFLSTGCPRCEECDGTGHTDDEDACPECNGEGVINEEPWFSWRPCECCGCHLGGDRETLSARHTPTKQVVTYAICVDCIYYIEYGRLDDTTMMRVEA